MLLKFGSSYSGSKISYSCPNMSRHSAFNPFTPETLHCRVRELLERQECLTYIEKNKSGDVRGICTASVTALG